ncbi:MAG: DUF222 domain-containing protein [Mycolicibacterium cosmeticum]|nr:DUF222 domain-containing protein [Mycolicibacterium cosmeticum]
MFDTNAGGVIDRMQGSARRENAEGALRLAAIGDLYDIRAPEDDVEKRCWAIDGHLSLVAEVATALAISRKRAEAQVRMAVTLRTKLPRVAAVYATGAIDYRMISMIVSRIELITDDELMTRIDTRLAEKVGRWARLSGPKTEQRIDAEVASADPIAVRDPDRHRRRRHVEVTPTDPGMGAVWANIDALAAAAWDALLDALAEKVCPADTRTKDERRADAFAAVPTGHYARCQCDDTSCPARSAPATPATVGVLIHVVAEKAALDGESDTPAYLPGHGNIAAEVLRDIAEHAKTREITVPPARVEPRYRPSTALAEFVRCRDLTCRFPGCDVSAWDCDVDHTVAFPAGPTHPSNLKCLCRFHHLLKTFHTGWSDFQLPDGTVVWTAPTGHTYLTEPEGAHWFPGLVTPTGIATAAPAITAPGRCHSMPPRKRTRAEDRTRRIDAERTANRNRLERRRLEHEARVAANEDSPPF